MADFKLPDRFETLDALPMTAVGKIDKQGLRARIAHAIAANQPLQHKTKGIMTLWLSQP